MKIMTERRNGILTEWQNAKLTLDAAKLNEAELRKVIVDELFDVDKLEGTENFKLANGWKLKAVKKLGYTLANGDGETTRAVALLPTHIADRLVKWSPKLSTREYKLLTDGERAIIDQALTIKPGLPTLTLIEPKG